VTTPAATGAQRLLQEVWHGLVWSARPMLAVEHHDGQGFWMPRGTEWRAPVLPPDAPDGLSRAESMIWCMRHDRWAFVDRVWRMDTLWLIPAEAHHAVWCCWDDGRFLGWYVNFQTPLRAVGPERHHYMDLLIDARVAPDRQWRWKDQEDLELARRAGLVTVAAEEAIMADAGVLQRQLASAEGPFAPEWTAWRPDPQWTRPDLPEDWNLPASPLRPG